VDKLVAVHSPKHREGHWYLFCWRLHCVPTLSLPDFSWLQSPTGTTVAKEWRILN